MRCPACSRPTDFYGIVSRPQAHAWFSVRECAHCEAFFFYGASGALAGGRRATDRNGFRRDLPREWLRQPRQEAAEPA